MNRLDEKFTFNYDDFKSPKYFLDQISPENIEGGEAVENGNRARMQLRTEAPFGWGKHYLHEGRMLNAETTNSYSTMNQQNSLVSVDHCGEKDGGALYPAKQVNQVGFQSEEDLKQVESRSGDLAQRTLKLLYNTTMRLLAGLICVLYNLLHFSANCLKPAC